MIKMRLIQTFAILVTLIFTCTAFVVLPPSTSFVAQKTEASAIRLSSSNDNNNDFSIDNKKEVLGRRQWLKIAGATTLFGTGVIFSSESALADVSDGTALPQGVQQFSKVVRLKSAIAVSF
jgi:hypothetical protein